MSDSGDDVPPPEAEGLDRPSDNDDVLDDTAAEFNDPDSAPAADPADDSDDDSLLSEVDEAQFADFDAAAVQVAPDFETLNRTIKVSKRKRVEGEEPQPKKRKEGTREKIKKNRRRQDSDEGFSGGEEIEGKRSRKSKSGPEGEKPKRRVVIEDIDEETLPPEERRRRALDRAMDAAIKKSSAKRIRKGDIDLEQMADQEIEDMRNRMIAAAEADGKLVEQGLPASAKLKMLPEVVALMNRNTYVQALLDPETNLLEAVRFFLEPLTDGSLPAYNIQRELFAVLGKLPMSKEALIASGIGKVIAFYKKSKRPEPAIKRQATKLMEEWSRPILQRSDDYTKKTWTKAVYDPLKRRDEFSSQSALVQKARVSMAPGEKKSNRAQLLPGATSYTIVPQSVNKYQILQDTFPIAFLTIQGTVSVTLLLFNDLATPEFEVHLIPVAIMTHTITSPEWVADQQDQRRICGDMGTNGDLTAAAGHNKTTVTGSGGGAESISDTGSSLTGLEELDFHLGYMGSVSAIPENTAGTEERTEELVRLNAVAEMMKDESSKLSYGMALHNRQSGDGEISESDNHAPRRTQADETMSEDSKPLTRSSISEDDPRDADYTDDSDCIDQRKRESSKAATIRLNAISRHVLYQPYDSSYTDAEPDLVACKHTPDIRILRDITYSGTDIIGSHLYPAELTRHQLGTADLMQLPVRLPPYWTPRPQAPGGIGYEDAMDPGHKFAIGQEVFMLSDEGPNGNSTPNAHLTDDTAPGFTLENVKPLIYLVDERKTVRVICIDENDEHVPGWATWYYLRARTGPDGLLPNRWLVHETWLMAVEYSAGEWVRYKLGRACGDRLGMRIAMVEGGFVRDGKRLYWLVEPAGTATCDGQMWWRLVKDVQEEDILPGVT